VKRCDLLLALGEALTAASEPRRVLETVAPTALELALEQKDRNRAFRACHVAMQALRLQSGGAVFFTTEWQTWARRADIYAETGTLERLEADLELAHTQHAANAPNEAWELANRGLALARDLQDRSSLLHAYEILLAWPGLPQHELERQQLCLDFPEALIDEVNDFVSAVDVWLVGANMLRWGLRSRAEAIWDAVSARAARVRSAGVRLLPAVSSTILATVEGDLENALRSGSQIPAHADAIGTVELAQRWSANSQRTALLYLGRGEEALAQVNSASVARPGPAGASGRPDAALAPEAALCFAHLGRHVDARRSLRAHLSPESAQVSQEILTTNSLTWLLEAAVLVRDVEAAHQFARRLSGAPAHISIALGTTASGTCPARHLGAAAALSGDRRRAHDYYYQALEAAEKIRFRPEIALTHLQMAQLFSVDQHDEAQRHLEFAIAELTDMRMAPGIQLAAEIAGRL
jgi:tetratricopeptide (TPR) repeat protein